MSNHRLYYQVLPFVPPAIMVKLITFHQPNKNSSLYKGKLLPQKEYLANALLLNSNNIATPIVMAESATLKIALKNVKGCPPIFGIHSGKFPLQIGK